MKGTSKNLRVRTCQAPFRPESWQKASKYGSIPMFLASFLSRKSAGISEQQVFGSALKKLLLGLFVLFASASFSLFASITDIVGDSSGYLYPGLSDRPFTYVDGRLEALGGTGVSLSTGASSLFFNPANLSDSKSFMLNIPSLNVRIYNVANLMSIEGAKDVLKALLSGSSPDPEATFNVVKTLIMNYSYGIYPFADLQADVGFSEGGFALDVLASGSLTFYNMTGGTSNARFVPSVALGASLGYGREFALTEKSSLHVGLSFSLLIRAHLAGISLSDIEGTDFFELIKSRDTGVVMQPPINLGVTMNFSDRLRASLVIRNLCFFGNTAYRYGTFGDFLSSPFRIFKGGSGALASSKISNLGSSFLSSSVDIGVAYNPKWKMFNPRFEIDMVNLLSFGKDEYYNNSNIFSHLKIGVELFLIGFIKLDAGLNQGRINFGLILDLWPIVIGVDYGWVDGTPTLGESMVDRLSISVKLGWDRSK